MGKYQRTRGHGFEREIANALRLVYPKASRQLEYATEDCVGVDIRNVGPFRIQCKRSKTYAPINRIEEVKAEGIPCLITRADAKKATATFYLEDILHLVSRFKTDPDAALQYLLGE